MDESAFRRARDAVVPRPCVFEQALLAGACACSLAARRNIAEREAVACDSSPAHRECAQLYALLLQKSAFALKLTHVELPLPHARQMKVECGGLLGVQQAAASAGDMPAPPVAQEPASVADVRCLVRNCVGKFGALANLPYSAIIQSVVAYQTRRRRPEQ